MDVNDFVSEVKSRGGFSSVKFSPHMRFRAGQRRLNWEKIKECVRSGDIERVEENYNPNVSIPFDEAYVIFISVDDKVLSVPMYFLENGLMKCVTVMRE